MPFQIVNHRYSLRGVYDYSWRESISFLSFLFINWDVCPKGHLSPPLHFFLSVISKIRRKTIVDSSSQLAGTVHLHLADTLICPKSGQPMFRSKIILYQIQRTHPQCFFLFKILLTSLLSTKNGTWLKIK